jgi:carboxylesterase type B
MSLHATVTQDNVEGFLDEGVHKFFGLPYAQAPVGALRWHAQDAWIAFVRTGAPCGMNGERWPAYTLESELGLLIDVCPSSSRTGDDPIVRLLHVLRAARR